MSKRVVVEGDAFVRTDAKTINIDIYEEEFILDDAIETEAEARSIIRKGLLHERLKKIIKNYKKYRTCNVLIFENTTKEADQSELSKKLIEAKKKNCTPENLDLYATDEGRVKAIEKAIETADRKKKRGRPKKSQQVVEDQGYID